MKFVVALITAVFAAKDDGDCTEAQQKRFDILMCESHQCSNCSLEKCVSECQEWQKQFPTCRCASWPEDRKTYGTGAGAGKVGDIGDYGKQKE